MPNESDDFKTLQTAFSDTRKYAGKVAFNTASASDYLTNEAFKTLRTNILFCGTDIHTILITSCRENEGKSTISTELCKCFADSGKHTLLIDADLRKSEMLRRGSKARDITGLSELLSGQAVLSEVLYQTQYPEFDVIFCGHFPPNPVELLGSQELQDQLDRLEELYDFIVIDSPPLGAVIDAAVIASHTDGSIMVLTDGKIGYREAKVVKEQLEKSGSRLLGVILNETSPQHSSYYKRYYKGHDYKYYSESSPKVGKRSK